MHSPIYDDEYIKIYKNLTYTLDNMPLTKNMVMQNVG